MLSILIGVVLGLGWATYLRTKPWSEAWHPRFWDRHGAFIPAPLGLALLGLIASVVISAAPTGTCQLDHHARLVNLSDAVSSQGNFVLGSGVLNSKMTYFYFVNTGEGYVEQSADASISTVVEDSPAHPYADVFVWRVSNPWRPFSLGDFGWTCGPTFHVPRGSVSANFHVG